MNLAWTAAGAVAGDVKLAGLTGLALAWLGWPVLVLGAAFGFAASAVVSRGLLAARRIGLRDSICSGPFMLGGALAAILLSGLARFLDWQGEHRPEPASRCALAGHPCRGRSAAGAAGGSRGRWRPSGAGRRADRAGLGRRGPAQRDEEPAGSRGARQERVRRGRDRPRRSRIPAGSSAW